MVSLCVGIVLPSLVLSGGSCVFSRRELKCGCERLESRQMLTSVDWGVEAINAPDVWAQGYTGKGAVVAVIDSGIDAHVDLIPNIWVNRNETKNNRDDDGNGYVDDLNGWNYVDGYYHPIGANTHGTHVSGTIAALKNGFGTTGVAYDAKIMPLRVFDDDGNGSTSDMASAVRYAVDNGADIINMSIGSTSTRNLTLALEYAQQKNVLIVAAAGNGGAKSPNFPATFSSELDNIISVGSHARSQHLSSTSNHVGSSGAVQVDAPGVGVESTVSSNKFDISSGTSIATAHVSGIAALALSANPDIDVAQLRSAIAAGATNVRAVGSDSIGIVNAKKTVELVLADVRESDLRADFNRDGTVGFDDFLVVARNFGSQNASHARGDVNGDGRVTFSDFLVLAQTFGDQQYVRRVRGIPASATASNNVAAALASPPVSSPGTASVSVSTQSTADSVDAAITQIINESKVDTTETTEDEGASPAPGDGLLFGLFASSHVGAS